MPAKTERRGRQCRHGSGGGRGVIKTQKYFHFASPFSWMTPDSHDGVLNCAQEVCQFGKLSFAELSCFYLPSFTTGRVRPELSPLFLLLLLALLCNKVVVRFCLVCRNGQTMEIVLDDRRRRSMVDKSRQWFSPVALRALQPRAICGGRERVRATGDNKTIKTVVKKTPSTSAAVESRNKRARKTPRWMWRVIIPKKRTRRRRRRPTPNLEESWHLLLRSSTTRAADATAAFFHPRRGRTQRKRQKGQEGNERERRKDGEVRKRASNYFVK